MRLESLLIAVLAQQPVLIGSGHFQGVNTMGPDRSQGVHTMGPGRFQGVHTTGWVISRVFTPSQPEAKSWHAPPGVSVQNRESKVTSFSSFAFLRAVTKMFLPEQFLYSYLKEDSGTQQTSSSYL